MKTTHLGLSTCTAAPPLSMIDPCMFLLLQRSLRVEALGRYTTARTNGCELDNPSSPIPTYESERSGPEANTAFRWESPDRSYSKVIYTETTAMRAWMEEKDRNYILRLAREGRLLEVEPHADTEIRPDHLYHDEICKALQEAREQVEKEQREKERKEREEQEQERREREETEKKEQAVVEREQREMAEKAHHEEEEKARRAEEALERAREQLREAEERTKQAEQEAAAERERREAIERSSRERAEKAVVDGHGKDEDPAPVGSGEAGGADPVDRARRDERLPVSPPRLFSLINRVWWGRHHPETVPHYEPVAPKPAGTAVGAIYEKHHTKPGARGPRKRWLGKVGEGQGTSSEHSSLFTRTLIRRGGHVGAIKEKVASDVYTMLSQGYYTVPKHRLAKLPLMNEYTRDNFWARELLEIMNRERPAGEEVTDVLHLMSKWIEGYKDLSELRVRDAAGASMPFMRYIEAHKAPAQYAIIDEVEVPIVGTMQILAAGRLLADTDVLGGGGKNTGYIVERDETRRPVRVRLVKIDAGYSFNFQGESNRLLQCFNPFAAASTKLADRRDIQYGNMQPVVIEWSCLSEELQREYLEALKTGIEFLLDDTNLRILIHRDGAFNRDEPLVTEPIVNELMTQWKRYVELQPQIYDIDLGSRSALAASP